MQPGVGAVRPTVAADRRARVGGAIGRVLASTILVGLAWLTPDLFSQAASREVVADGAPIIRVGLATDEREVVLVDATGLEVVVDGELVDAAPRVVVRPAGTLTRDWTYRLQVAAIRELQQAQRVAAEFERATGLVSDLAFDAETGLTRVRIGTWNRRPPAEREQARLKAAGHQAWMVEEPGNIADAGLTVEGSRALRVDGRVDLRRADTQPIFWRDGRYRGALRVALNRRGQLNVVLLSDLEDYLRGVVPREMGPRVYDDLEALKAQTVAARSYVLHNLGEFEDEGFDVCASTRCQAFAGVGAEHPLSDRAIRETSGLVLVTTDGRPADTLYTATCGGHTEDVETVFPTKHHRYLRGVPCVEAGTVGVGPRSNWSLIESNAVRSLIGELGSNPLEIGESLRRAVERAGVPAAEDRLQSFEREEVKRFLASVLDLVANPAWLSAKSTPESGAPPLANSLHQIAVGEGRVTVAELRRVLYQVGEVVGLIDGRSVSFLGQVDDVLRVHSGTDEWSLGPAVAWHWPGGGATRAMAAGDPLDLVLVEGRPLAVLVPDRSMRADGAAPGTRTWSEFRSDRDLAERAATEFPGFEYASLEPGENGVSGRLRSLRLRGRDGSTRTLEGLPIRWFLDLPETRFSARRGRGSRGEPGWTFTGRGWGHGVGMCQRGAYRMGLRGVRFQEILEHYYTGLKLALYDPGRTGKLRRRSEDVTNVTTVTK